MQLVTLSDLCLQQANRKSVEQLLHLIVTGAYVKDHETHSILSQHSLVNLNYPWIHAKFNRLYISRHYSFQLIKMNYSNIQMSEDSK